VQLEITDKMPSQCKLAFALWARRTVQPLIKQLWGKDMSIRTIGDYLQRWRFTQQKPLKEAYKQDLKRVGAWLNEQYSQIKERAKQENAEIHWGDETELRNDSQHGRSYAPKGKKPVQPID
tara:strand:+ start:10732 stop:11094 length:363 start_codon:yes stop_codon:yes gene_type:complete